MATSTAKRKVVANPAASTAAAIGTALALLSYLTGLAGLDVPTWVTSLVVGWGIGAALGFAPAGGLTGIWRFLLYGNSDKGG